MRKKDQPYDRYVKDLMQDPELVKEFLFIYLDKDIQQAIEWSTLTPYDTSLIGSKGKQLYADVLYKALTKKGGAEMFFIFNHERKPDQLLPVKVEEYVLGTLRKSVRQDQKNLASSLPSPSTMAFSAPIPIPTAC